MSSKIFYFPFKYKEFLMDTAGWSLECQMAYLLYIIHQIHNKGKGIPADDQQRARIIGLDQNVAKFERIWDVVKTKYRRKNGYFKNSEAKKTAKKIQNLSKAGLVGAEARWEIERKKQQIHLVKSNDEGMRSQSDRNAIQSQSQSIYPIGLDADKSYIFSRGLQFLKEVYPSKSEQQIRGLLGKLLQASKEGKEKVNASLVKIALENTQVQKPAEPFSYMLALIRRLKEENKDPFVKQKERADAKENLQLKRLQDGFYLPLQDSDYAIYSLFQKGLLQESHIEKIIKKHPHLDYLHINCQKIRKKIEQKKEEEE